MIEVRFNCESATQLRVEMAALLGGNVTNLDVGKGAAESGAIPARLAGVADAAGIPAQPVKNKPGRKPAAAAAAPAANTPPAAAAAAVAAAPVVEDPAGDETTFEDYKTFMTGAYTGGSRGIVLEVLAEFGATKISEVPADKYDEVMAAVQTKIDAAVTG